MKKLGKELVVGDNVRLVISFKKPYARITNIMPNTSELVDRCRVAKLRGHRIPHTIHDEVQYEVDNEV